MFIQQFYVDCTIYTLKCETVSVKNQCRQYSGYTRVNLQTFPMKYNCFICVDQPCHISMCTAQIRQLMFLWNISIPHADFSKSQPTFRLYMVKMFNTFGRIMLDIRRNTSFFIVRSTGPLSSHRGVAARPSRQKCTLHTFGKVRWWEWKG